MRCKSNSIFLNIQYLCEKFRKNKKVIHIPAYKANAIDVTAAGDYYAAGFFYGLSKNGSLEQCGKIGALLASNIVETVGTKLTEDCWKIIKNKTNEILN